MKTTWVRWMVAPTVILRHSRANRFTRAAHSLFSLWESAVDEPIKEGEIRIVIQASKVADSEVAPIPARVFARSVNNLIGALKIAHRAAFGRRSARNMLFVSHLKMGSNEFGVSGNDFAVNELRRSAIDAYRSNFSRVRQSPEMVRAAVLLSKTYSEGYSIVAKFKGEDLPIDEFFVEQVSRLIEPVEAETAVDPPFFSGTVIGSFDGKLGELDYRGVIWRGHLLLSGSNISIECIFDRSKGEDSINPYGNKRVSLSGRAIYTGASPLPARIEVISIQAIPAASSYKEMSGSMNINKFSNWSRKH